MRGDPSTHVASVVAEALLTDGKRPKLYTIYEDLDNFIKKEYSELYKLPIAYREDGTKEDHIRSAFRNVMHLTLLKKVPGLYVGDSVRIFEEISNLHKKFGIGYNPLTDFDKINDIEDELQKIVDKHCGTLKELENFR